MRQHLDLSLDLIDESADNPRLKFSDEGVRELAASVQAHGVMVPIIVRPVGDRFVVVCGARRVRAARLADLSTIPAIVDVLDDEAANVIAIIENLHRENLTPLDEALSYQRLLSAHGRKDLDEVAALCGKPKAYIHQRLTLTRLIPAAAEFLASGVLPLAHALKLATVPTDRQESGLELCFSPLFRDSQPRTREMILPLAVLVDWIKNTVRLNPHSRDTQILLPELAEQVTRAEEERHATILAVSDLPNHSDRTAPLPILRKSWKEADSDEDRCGYARPAVIVLGERRNTFLLVCIDKERCSKHWGKPLASGTDSGDGEAPQVQGPEAPSQPSEFARQRNEEARLREAWLNEDRPRALRLFAERSVKLPLSGSLIHQVLLHLDADEVEEFVGPIAELPADRWPQALALAVALPNSWTRDRFQGICKDLGVSLEENETLVDAPSAEAPPPATTRSGRRKSRRGDADAVDTAA